jgi:hypothetical protein
MENIIKTPVISHTNAVLHYMYMLLNVYSAYFILDYIFYTNFADESIVKLEISY